LAQFADNIAVVQALGGIQLIGVAPMGGTPGFARIQLATTNIAEAVHGAELVMVVVPAYGHEAFMRELIACAQTNQVIVFQSGYFATPVFARMLANAGRKEELLIGETTSLIYQARLQGAGKVFIKACKRKMPFATLPASRTSEALQRINQVYSQFVPAQNIFDASLNEAGILVHPITTLLNLSRIEQIGPYRSSYYDLTPSMGRVMDAVDTEKQSLQRTLKLRAVSLPMMINEFFGVTGANCYEVMRACPSYHTQTTPDNLQHRYITEDVPYGLVPIASLGEHLGLNMRNTRTIINLASAANGVDYWETGRTVERMGLSGMELETIIRHVN
jgi:opine dehydrogenase